MNTPKTALIALATIVLATSAFAPRAQAQARRGAPPVVSPELSSDRHVTFRLLAPNAQNVRLVASDIPSAGSSTAMTKGSNGVWEATLGPIDPGEYRYYFNVDGMIVVTPRNPSWAEAFTTSESNANTWSLLYVAGSAFMDTRDVPHGAVETVTYFSKSLNRFRRMHIYTPPGYEKGSGKYPLFYLLHGASDSDDAWSTVGRAGFIMDNLIADKKAKPMVVVMPAGHTSAGIGGGRGAAPGATNAAPRDEFNEDFLNDVMPYVESHYRVYTDQSRRAIAGLSMGGAQTMTAAFATLDKFAYIGVFSSGVGLMGGNATSWEEQHKATLDNAKLKKNIKLIWLATGKNDSLLPRSRDTVAMLKKHGFNPFFQETEGAHTWVVWRNYLNEFAPQLFQ
jgi:enterochelin esterase-like enzyme